MYSKLVRRRVIFCNLHEILSYMAKNRPKHVQEMPNEKPMLPWKKVRLLVMLALRVNGQIRSVLRMCSQAAGSWYKVTLYYMCSQATVLDLLGI